MFSRCVNLTDGVLCIIPADRLIWAHWESASSVYDRRTGETHLLSVLPTEVLHLLEQGPHRLPPLCEQLALLCETDNSPVWQAKLQDILLDLMRLEIVDYRPDAA